MSVDDTPIEATEDTGLSEEAQTSDDVALEDVEVDLNAISDDDELEAATDSEESTEPDDSAEESEETEDSEAEQSDKTDEAEDKTEAERKRFNDEMAKQRIAERKAREEAQQARKELQQEQIRNYLAEAEGDEEELKDRQTAVERWRLQQEKAALNAEKLEVSMDRAIADIDLFRDGTDLQKKYMLKAIDEFEAKYVVKDNDGNPVEVNGNLYQFLKTEAESIRELHQDGAVKEAKTKEKVKARTITPPSRAPQKAAKDPYVEAFENALND